MSHCGLRVHTVQYVKTSAKIETPSLTNYTQNFPPPPSATEAGDHVTDDLTAAVPAKKLKRRNAALYTPGSDC
jgi:hypothetical protein